MDVDALAVKVIAVAQGEGSEGTSNGWTWLEEGCTGAARQGKRLGDGHCATSGTSSFNFAEDVTEDAGKLADKLEQSERQRERRKIQGKRQRRKKRCAVLALWEDWSCGSRVLAKGC